MELFNGLQQLRSSPLKINKGKEYAYISGWNGSSAFTLTNIICPLRVNWHRRQIAIERTDCLGLLLRQHFLIQPQVILQNSIPLATYSKSRYRASQITGSCSTYASIHKQPRHLLYQPSPTQPLPDVLDYKSPNPQALMILEAVVQHIWQGAGWGKLHYIEGKENAQGCYPNQEYCFETMNSWLSNKGFYH